MTNVAEFDTAIARVNFGAPVEKVQGELLDALLPVDEHLRFESVFDECACIGESG